jgi:hypothetical protein
MNSGSSLQLESVQTLVGVKLVQQVQEEIVGIGAEERCGGDRVIYCPIAWLPPGYYPGAAGGVATTGWQRAFCALGHF